MQKHLTVLIDFSIRFRNRLHRVCCKCGCLDKTLCGQATMPLEPSSDSSNWWLPLFGRRRKAMRSFEIITGGSRKKVLSIMRNFYKFMAIIGGDAFQLCQKGESSKQKRVFTKRFLLKSLVHQRWFGSLQRVAIRVAVRISHLMLRCFEANF